MEHHSLDGLFAFADRLCTASHDGSCPAGGSWTLRPTKRFAAQAFTAQPTGLDCPFALSAALIPADNCNRNTRVPPRARERQRRCRRRAVMAGRSTAGVAVSPATRCIFLHLVLSRWRGAAGFRGRRDFAITPDRCPTAARSPVQPS